MPLYDMLFPYQKNIVDKFKDKEAYGLFLDMGLGKTPIALAFAEVNNCSKVIIISINSKAEESVDVGGSWFNWASKSKFNYELINKKILFNKKKCPEFKNDTPGVLLLNYESLYSRDKNRKTNVELKSEIIKFINSCIKNNVAIIIDESHKIKDTSSMQSKAINMIKKMCSIKANRVYSYLLTGTPFTQGFIDLYAQLKFLGCPMTKGDFEDRFCVRDTIPGLLPFQQPIKSYKNIEGIYNLVHQYAITIKSNEVVNLPEQIFVNHISPQSKYFNLLTKEKLPCKTINLELGGRGLDLINIENQKKMVNNPFYRNLAYPNTIWMSDTVATLWMRARQCSIGFQGNAESCEYYDKTRFDQLREFLQNNEDNYLLFYNFTPELVEIYDICNELGYKIDLFCGEAKSLYFYEEYAKMNEEERFNNKKRIIISNFASGSTGTNWQLYNKCIVFSLPIYRDWEQGIKRIHRTGQKETCVYHLFYQNNWLDASMKKSLEENSDYTKEMFERDLARVRELKEDE